MREYSERQGVDFTNLDREDRFSEVEKLCNGLISSIEGVIPVLPISLVATVFLEAAEDWLTEFDVKGRVYRLMEELQERDAHVYTPKRGRELGVATALNMLRIRRMITESDGLLQADPGSHDILSYYANAISHWRAPSTNQTAPS
jgi:glycerol-3-phosphate O-acyltransferase